MVNTVARTFQRAGYIRYSRGIITNEDRAAVEEVSREGREVILKTIPDATDVRDGEVERLLNGEGFIGYRCYLIGLDGTIGQHEKPNAADDSTAAEVTQEVPNRSACFCAELEFLDRRISQPMKAVPC
jgi:hypothetical protein